MVGYLLFGILYLVLAGIPIGLGLLIYFALKNLGYQKAGKYLTIIYGVVILTIIVMSVFEDQLFTKQGAKKLIEEQEIELFDDFKLENNKSSSIYEDYYHTFTLKISEKDRLNAIQLIKNSKNFIEFKELPNNSQFYININRYYGLKSTQNYETKNSYVREFYRPNGENYKPTFKRISINKTKNELIFEEY
jgi:hypothetical protein